MNFEATLPSCNGFNVNFSSNASAGDPRVVRQRFRSVKGHRKRCVPNIARTVVAVENDEQMCHNVSPEDIVVCYFLMLWRELNLITKIVYNLFLTYFWPTFRVLDPSASFLVISDLKSDIAKALLPFRPCDSSLCHLGSSN